MALRVWGSDICSDRRASFEGCRVPEDFDLQFQCCLFARYFDEDDEHVTPTSTLEYIPAPGSPSYQPQGGQSSDSEEDPLDAFMAGIEREVQRETVKIQEKEDKKKGIRDDIEEEDVEESYYR